MEHHEGVLSNFGVRVGIGDPHHINSDRSEWNDTVILQKAMVGDYSLNVDWNDKRSPPPASTDLFLALQHAT